MGDWWFWDGSSKLDEEHFIDKNLLESLIRLQLKLEFNVVMKCPIQWKGLSIQFATTAAL